MYSNNTLVRVVQEKEESLKLRIDHCYAKSQNRNTKIKNDETMGHPGKIFETKSISQEQKKTKIYYLVEGGGKENIRSVSLISTRFHSAHTFVEVFSRVFT